MMHDITVALRQWLKNPGFAAVAVLTLALVIGANTAIFSIVRHVLLKPLPYPDSDRLVTLWERSHERGMEQERVSGPDYLDWRQQNTVFANLSVNPGWDGVETFNLVAADSTVKIRASYVSASFFPTLGVNALLGRTLLPEEDQREGNRAAVLSYDLWQRQFAGSSNIIGRTLTLDTYGRRDYTIVGVMPQGFGVPSQSELWLPLGWMGVRLDERRSAHWHNVIGRLKPGVTLAQAGAEMSALQRRLKEAYPAETIGSEVAIVPLLDQALGQDRRRALLILWAVVGGVLLIACANIANLLLARAASRDKEMALRVALGAGYWRLVRQLLVESVMLALAGGLLGVLLGWWGLRLFISLSPPNIPRLAEATLDPAALCFTAAISCLTGLLFGLAPCRHFSRPDINATLNEGSRAASAGPAVNRMRNVLIISEVALSVVLLAGAGLMIQSLARILRIDRGFEPQHLLTIELDFSVSGFTTWVQPTTTRPQVPLHELMERLRALPGVQVVGAGSRFLRREKGPLSDPVAIFGRPSLTQDSSPKAQFKGITPDWVRALGARVLQGRDFTEADALNAPGAVLVNETFAKRCFPNENPVGQHIKVGSSDVPLHATDVWGLPEWKTIIGVVSDIKSLRLRPEVVPEVFQSYWQWPMQNPTVLIRARGDPAMLAETIRRETKSMIPKLPAPIIRTMDSLLSEVVAEQKLQTGLMGMFACLALLLAVVGLYGVLAYTTAQRTREIGVRLALGAQKRQVLTLVVGCGMRLVLAGAGLGLILSFALTRVLRSLLYDVNPTDPATFGIAGVLMCGTALVACLIPAHRAARVDPIAALRYE
jgi:putative ABC transport system permease protein